MTLHAAISAVLESRNEAMGAGEIAREIEARQLYLRPKDGKPAKSNQVRARAKNYSSLFVIQDARIALKSWV